MAQMTAEQALGMVQKLFGEGKMAEAEQVCGQILTFHPQHADAWNAMGVIVASKGDWVKGAGMLERAIALSPRQAHFHGNRGSFLLRGGLNEEAVRSFREAVRLEPGNAGAHFNLGCGLHAAGDWAGAVESFRTALRLQPNHADALNNLGNALRDMGRLDEAIAAYEQAVKLRPDFWGAMRCLGNAYKDQGLLDTAFAWYERAAAVNPADIVSQSNRLYALYFHAGYDGARILREHREWDRRHAAGLKQFWRPHANDRSPERRLRVGYVGPYFRTHAVASCFLLALLTHHDPSQVEVFCYSGVERPDAITTQFQAKAAHWRDIRFLSDEQLAEKVREDRIDILVDLTLHMEGLRLLTFARRPAPVQVNWAYPATSGVTGIDYRLTDIHLDPPGVGDEDYSEKSVRLPRTFWCHEAMVETPEVNALPALANGHVTFGCFNNFCKVTPETLALWGEVMRAVPGSKLLMLARPGAHRERVRNVLEKEGVARDRVDYVDMQEPVAYFRSYHRVDMILDPVPYPGHTSGMDGLWMGVPAVTMSGRTAASRGGVSLLMNVGMPEFIAKSTAEYVAIAVKMAGDLQRLAEVRAGLRERMKKSPLKDGRAFAADAEAAYREMWRKWCENGGTR